MSTASITLVDGDDGLEMKVQYVGGWNADSKAHRAIHDMANAIGEPIGEPVFEFGDKAAEPKLILSAG